MAHAQQLLISRALEGDAAAVRELVDLLTPVIQRRAARALLRKPRRAGRDIRQEVEDLAQEVFLSLFDDGGRALRAWDPVRGLSLKNFVGLLTERQVASILRSGRRSGWAEEAVDQQRIEAITKQEVPADTRVASRQTLTLLLDRLRESLSPRGLELFYRLMVHQESVASVCESTGMSTDAIHAWRSRLARLARKIANEIEAEKELVTGRHNVPSGSSRTARIP